MATISTSKARHYVNKLAVTSEPGLTNAQLLLTNHDLRPGEEQTKSLYPDSVLGTHDADNTFCGSGTGPTRMGSMELRGLLDCRLREYRMCLIIPVLSIPPRGISSS